MCRLFIAGCSNESCISIIMIYWRREGVNLLWGGGIGQFVSDNFPEKNLPGGIFLRGNSEGGGDFSDTTKYILV